MEIFINTFDETLVVRISVLTVGPVKIVYYRDVEEYR